MGLPEWSYDILSSTRFSGSCDQSYIGCTISLRYRYWYRNIGAYFHGANGCFEWCLC